MRMRFRRLREISWRTPGQVLFQTRLSVLLNLTGVPFEFALKTI